MALPDIAALTGRHYETVKTAIRRARTRPGKAKNNRKGAPSSG
jgi:transposase